MQEAKKPKTTTANTKMPVQLKVFLWIFGIFIVIGVVSSVVAGFFATSILGGVFSNNKVKVDQSGNVEVKTDDGKVSFTNKKELPSTWPTDLPVYPGAIVESSFTGEKSLVNVHFSSDDDSQKVIDYYKQQLASNGWKADGDNGYFSLGGGIGIATKDDRRVQLTILQNDKPKEGELKTVITIAVIKTTPTPAAE
mgnify:FL=1